MMYSYLIYICPILPLCSMMCATQDFSDADECRTLEFRPEKAFDGKRLVNHVIRVVEIMIAGFCKNVCYMEPDCVSINLDKTAEERGKYLCELNNVTQEGHEHELEENKDYFHHSADSACVTNRCKNEGTCQSGFTDKGYRCLCSAGFKGEDCGQDIDESATETHSCNANAVCNNTEGSYKCSCKPGYFGDGKICTMISTCKEIYERNILNKSGKVVLLLDSKPISVFCHMGDFGCGDGGWTPVMKIDGSKETFHYDSHFWSDRKAYNLSGGETGFDLQQTKLPTYWNTSFSKICLGMRIEQQTKFTVINEHANSLHSLIVAGIYHATSLGRNTWKKLIGSEVSLQQNCNKEGFNAEGSKLRSSKARIGIIANNENDCSSCDSRIGFGTGGYPDDFNTCGNEAKHSRDNGDKHIKAMGYILVQ